MGWLFDGMAGEGYSVSSPESDYCQPLLILCQPEPMGLIEDHDRTLVGISRVTTFQASGETFARESFVELYRATARFIYP